MGEVAGVCRQILKQALSIHTGWVPFSGTLPSRSSDTCLDQVTLRQHVKARGTSSPALTALLLLVQVNCVVLAPYRPPDGNSLHLEASRITKRMNGQTAPSFCPFPGFYFGSDISSVQRTIGLKNISQVSRAVQDPLGTDTHPVTQHQGQAEGGDGLNC